MLPSCLEVWIRHWVLLLGTEWVAKLSRFLCSLWLDRSGGELNWEQFWKKRKIHACRDLAFSCQNSVHTRIQWLMFFESYILGATAIVCLTIHWFLFQKHTKCNLRKSGFFFNVAGKADKRTSVVSLKRGIFASSALIRTSLKSPPKILLLLTCCTLTNM